MARLAWIAVLLCAVSVVAEDTDPGGQKYLLRYSLTDGQKLHYEVTHAAKTKTRVRGSEDVATAHTISERHWDVIKVDDKQMTFDHVVDNVEMTQQQNEKEEIRWSSGTDKETPAQFSKVAEQIGKKLSTISINKRGQELEREDRGGSKASLGMGSLALAFPEEAIAIGDSWAVPREIKTRTEDGVVKPIKIRELYTLEKVKTGIATLSIISEPLTPIDQESVRAQVVQQLSNGEIRFDMDAGHMISKELNWDETVVGFQGANSLMEYRARMNERLIEDAPRTARRQ